MASIKNIQSSINSVETVTRKVSAQSSPAVKNVVKHLSISDPIIGNYAKSLGITHLDGVLFRNLHELGLKIEGTGDKLIKDTIYNQIKQAENYGVFTDTGFPIDLLDAYHSAKGDYSPIGGRVQDFYQYLKKEVSPKQAQIIAGKENSIEKLFLMFKPTEKKTRIEYKQSFEKARKLEPLKDFCYNYEKTKPKMTKHLYETYYLPMLKPEARQICQKIADEFGTKLFLGHDDNHKAANAVYKEFSEWKNAGGAEVLYPNTFDCSKIKQDYIRKNVPAGGFLSYVGRRFEKTMIALPNDDLSSISPAIRHEMTHLNDKKYFDKIGCDAVGFIKKREGKRPFEDELEKSGISKRMINYANTDMLEFKAVSSQGDYSSYSDHFKKFLVRIGLPEWQFKMKPVKDMDYFG